MECGRRRSPLATMPCATTTSCWPASATLACGTRAPPAPSSLPPSSSQQPSPPLAISAVSAEASPVIAAPPQPSPILHDYFSAPGMPPPFDPRTAAVQQCLAYDEHVRRAAWQVAAGSAGLSNALRSLVSLVEREESTRAQVRPMAPGVGRRAGACAPERRGTQRRRVRRDRFACLQTAGKLAWCQPARAVFYELRHELPPSEALTAPKSRRWARAKIREPRPPPRGYRSRASPCSGSF